MNPTQLRRIAKKYGTLGVLFVGAVLLLHSLWRRKPLMLASFCVLVLAAGFLLPNCNQPDRRAVSTYFDPQVDAQEVEVEEVPSEEPFAFRVIDLGVLPGGEISEATGISDKGQVAGVSDVSGDTVHGFFWNGGKLRDIGTLSGGQGSIALGINDSEQIVGIGDDRQGMIRGFVWQNGKMRDVGHLGGSLTLACGINNRGGVVGVSATKDFIGHAFFWQDGKMRDIGTPKGSDYLSFARDVNDSGTVVGFAITGQGSGEVLDNLTAIYARRRATDKLSPFDDLYPYFNTLAPMIEMLRTDGQDSARAFVWKNGKFTELRGNRDETAALSINTKGQVVGADFTESDESIRAMLWESEQGKELPLLPGFTGSLATDISDSGIIVGGAFNDEEITACAWKDGKAHDLNKLLPADSGWTLYFANSINAKGQIVGVGEHNGQLRAFLLDPKG